MKGLALRGEVCELWWGYVSVGLGGGVREGARDWGVGEVRFCTGKRQD